HYDVVPAGAVAEYRRDARGWRRCVVGFGAVILVARVGRVVSQRCRRWQPRTAHAEPGALRRYRARENCGALVDYDFAARGCDAASGVVVFDAYHRTANDV